MVPKGEREGGGDREKEREREREREKERENERERETAHEGDGYLWKLGCIVLPGGAPEELGGDEALMLLHPTPLEEKCTLASTYIHLPRFFAKLPEELGGDEALMLLHPARHRLPLHVAHTPHHLPRDVIRHTMHQRENLH